MKSAATLVALVALHLLSRARANELDEQMLARLGERCGQEGWACVQERALRALVDADQQQLAAFAPGYEVRRVRDADVARHNRSLDDPDQYLMERTWDYLNDHQLTVSLADPRTGARTFSNPIDLFARIARTASANTFITGFGLGFLAFGLKKLLLPFFLGAQLVKSILIAIFLPTLLTSIGKFLGKSGASIFSASTGNGHHSSDDYDFKDNFDPNTFDTSATSNVAAFTNYPQNRLDTMFPSTGGLSGLGGLGGLRVSPYKPPFGIRPYAKRPVMDFKNFNKVSSASLMLSNFDPFYSPILSRLDAVFKQMGHEKSVEDCKEKLICSMYQMPAKYAPFSNLVSAQLSRDLSELHRPSNNNPDVMRFFRYMKAAKDGQEGVNCAAEHAACTAPEPTVDVGGANTGANTGAKSDHSTLFGSASPPMVKTYNEINKLVQARRLAKQLDVAHQPEDDSPTTA